MGLPIKNVVAASIAARSLRGGLAEAVELEATLVHAMALGIDEARAREVVEGLRRETSWDWQRIRDEITKAALS